MACKPLTYEDFIEVWRRVLPNSYTVPIEDEGDGRGFDVPSFQARIFAEFSQATDVLTQAYYLRRWSRATHPWAAGARKASGTVEVTRAAPTVGALSLPAGTRLVAYVTSSLGRRLVVGTYVTTAAVALGEAVGPFLVPAEAEFPGYAGNLPAGLLWAFEPLVSKNVPAQFAATDTATAVIPLNTATDTFDSSDLGRVFRVVTTTPMSPASQQLVPRQITGTIDSPAGIQFTPPIDAADVGVSFIAEVEGWEDLGLTISQPLPIEGGTSGMLDAIGADRGVGRLPNESDDSYRARIGDLGDTISPAAMERILACTLGCCGIPYTLAETGDIDGLMGFTWDVHPFDIGGLGVIPKLPGSQLVGQGIVYLDQSSYRRFFIVTVGPPSSTPVGLAFNDGPFPDAFDERQPFDGANIIDPAYAACIAAAWEKLNAARAAGVGFVIVQDPNL